MDYENMRVAELKALARERGLRGYFQLKKRCVDKFHSRFGGPTGPASREMTTALTTNARRGASANATTVTNATQPKSIR